ncbi:MAG TPA: ATP-binding protein [Blastocatellia bacterium]|nr:ATP-binding protein [Blastocatellia bacterium]
MFNSNILIVDDEEFLVELYKELLSADSAKLRQRKCIPGTHEAQFSQQGYKIHIAYSGATAVELVAKLKSQGEQIACGFFDMKMPGGMDGLETIRQIRIIDPQVLCTIVTSFNQYSLDEIGEAFGLGHLDDWDYMNKPFTRDEVIQKARNWVSAWNRRRREEAQAQDLQRVLTEIEAMNQQLEGKVKERTAELESANSELGKKNHELEDVLLELKSTQGQLLQNEKMASLGQLAAGMAHEINNPIGFVYSNLCTLNSYTDRVQKFMNAVDLVINQIGNGYTPLVTELNDTRRKLKMDYVLKDLKAVVDQSIDGATRVQQIVKDLKTFSRVDEAELKQSDINEGIKSTLNIVHNELKYKATVTTDLGNIPPLLCYPMQLNQVFLNLLMNAGQSIESQGKIAVKTFKAEESIFVEVSDTGCGIPEENIKKIFEPFYTTKPVGKGTGLGLSMSYSIVNKHKGEIRVTSERGSGTTFTVVLPLNAFANVST